MEGGVPVLLNDGIDYTIVEGGTGERIRNSTLTVVGTEPSDALDYFCRASNVVNTAEATAELIVHGECGLFTIRYDSCYRCLLLNANPCDYLFMVIKTMSVTQTLFFLSLQ